MSEAEFFDLLIKQLCRRSVYESNMGLWQSKSDSNTPLYSQEVLKKLYDKPADIQRVLKTPEKSLNGLLTPYNYPDFTLPEKKKFIFFLEQIKQMEPPSAKSWAIVQHYMHFVYRNFVTPNPEQSQDKLSDHFLQEFRDAIKVLMAEDVSQLFIRIFMLLREYCIFAHWSFSQMAEMAENCVIIKTLIYYYEAMLSSAKCINNMFPELEALLNRNYAICWIDFNNYIFINYFFDTEYIQNKIYEFQNTIKPSDKSRMFELLENLRKMWVFEQKRITDLCESLAVPENQSAFDNDNLVMEEQKKLLVYDLWIDRSTKALDFSRLDHHIFRLINDPSLKYGGPILDKTGQCICENCMVGRFQKMIQIEEDPEYSKPFARLGYCKKCNLAVELGSLHHHVTEHYLDRKGYELNAFNQKDPQTRLLEDLENLHLDTQKICDDAFISEQYWKQRVTRPRNKSDQVLNKNAKNFIKIKKDMLNNGFSLKPTILPSPPLKNDKDDKKMRELMKTRMDEGLKSIAALTALKNSSKDPPKEAHCKHSCKHEDDLKAELKKGCKGGCEHHKESKSKCDCNYCEVFGTNVSAHTHKKSELRNKLRIRLYQRREGRTKALPTPSTTITNSRVQNEERVPPHTSDSSPEQEASPEVIPEDISGLLNYIEGKGNKIPVVDKKAAKKERQRQKKEEERLKIEEEERRKQAEERRKEEERKKAEELAKQLAKKARMQQMSKKERKRMKKNGGKEEEIKPVDNVVEETIPAMVTIKRVAENGGKQPTVTITLKGSTPDQDKLLYTLVNGADKVDEPAEKKEVTNNNNNKKKNKKQDAQPKPQQVLSKELKVTLALDPSTQSEGKKKKKKEKSPEQRVEAERQEEPLPLLLNLPPGITITKVEGSPSNRIFKTTNIQDQPPGSTINVNGKSGVIVVDTEKLIQQNGVQVPKGKKSKRKKKKNDSITITNTTVTNAQMVTLKNPIFQSLHSKPPEAVVERNLSNECAPAAIFTSENGMVTIRSSRLQQSLGSSSVMPMPIPMVMSELKPVIGPEMTKTPEVPQQPAPRLSPFNAQEILSGLPGIEITKVGKRRTAEELGRSSCQTAQVSIIPASTNGDNKFSQDKDDWTFDSVFTPKDIPEDDMDADERELEAFKRFCQQSVPPKTKEKVAHLNVKDIVLKKKTDTNCV